MEEKVKHFIEKKNIKYFWLGLLKIADALKIKGLVEIEEDTISKPSR